MSDIHAYFRWDTVMPEEPEPTPPTPPPGPAPTPASSTTYWHLALGGELGGWLGAAAANVSEGLASGAALRIALHKDPLGGELLRIIPRWEEGVAQGAGVDLGAGPCVTLGVYGSEEFARAGEFTFDHVLPGEQGVVDPIQQFTAAYLLADALSRLKAPPVLGLLTNALQDARQQSNAAPYFTARESRVEVRGSLDMGAGVQLGVASVSAHDAIREGVFAAFRRQPAPFTTSLVGCEVAAGADVPALQTELSAADARLTPYLAALTPQAGPTGVARTALELGGAGGSRLRVSYAADSAEQFTPFISRSALDTRDILVEPQPLRDLGNLDLFWDALHGVVDLRAETSFRQSYADAAAGLIQWSAAHPGTTAGAVTATREDAEGTQGTVSIDVDVLGWAGVETNLEWCALKGFEYPLASGVFRDGGVTVTETHTAATVPAEDSRYCGQMVWAILHGATAESSPTTGRASTTAIRAASISRP